MLIYRQYPIAYNKEISDKLAYNNIYENGKSSQTRAGTLRRDRGVNHPVPFNNNNFDDGYVWPCCWHAFHASGTPIFYIKVNYTEGLKKRPIFGGFFFHMANIISIGINHVFFTSINGSWSVGSASPPHPPPPGS